MVTFSFDAIGTRWWIEIFDVIDEKTLTVVADHGERFAKTFESNYSRFKSDSLLSVLNRERTLQNPSLEFQTLLTCGKAFYLRSNTVFNFLSGHHLEARGYDASYSFTIKADYQNLPVCTPVSDLEISNELITLHCGNLDIGGYGKGYLIDLLVDLLRSYNLEYFLINGGGDMYATSNQGKPIEIYLEHPTSPGEYLMKTTLENQGFAASSPFKRQWVHESKVYTHIISQTTPEPLSSFIKAKTACDADAFATSALLLSQNQIEQIAKDEHFNAARFSPETNLFWQTAGF